MERLHKVLARAGIASRRAAERLIGQGRVRVNGVVTRTLGVRVDAAGDRIEVDGQAIPAAPREHVYLMLNKPRGYLTTLSDPHGRPTIVEFLGPIDRRVFPVGRLDCDTEGLLLLTDDGELARDLMHPRTRVPKTYVATVEGRPAAQALVRLAGGTLVVEGRRALPASVRMLRAGVGRSTLQITVVEGRKRQVRRMLAAVGHPVCRLRRSGFAGLSLGRLAVGELRRLGTAEVRRLRRAVGDPGCRPARRSVID